MNDNEFNLGILLGGAAAAISVFAALAALYLWAVDRARQKLDKTADPSTSAVSPWLSPLRPLLLPTLAILCLGFVAGLWHAYEEKSWQKASTTIFTAWPAFMILMFWLKLRKNR